MTDTSVQVSTIVVGVDGSEAGDTALEWAAAEARRTGCAMHLVHAYTQPIVAMSQGMMVYDVELDAAGKDLVAKAALRASAIAPGIEIRTSVHVSSPAQTILETAVGADTVVVGSRGRGALAGALLGSTALQVATHSSCPTIVVRELAEDATEGPRHVVVGTDGSPTSNCAVGYAFEQAAARGCELVVVHAWADDLAAAPMVASVMTDRLVAVEEQQRTLVREVVSEWSGQYPDVVVHDVVANDSPAAVLVRESVGAEMVVVGSRGRGGFRSLLLGSVSQQVLRHAECPVAIIRPVAPTPDPDVGSGG